MLKFLLYILSCSILVAPDKLEIRAIQLQGFAQGTTWHATYYANDSIVTTRDIDSILKVIDSSLSLYKPNSLIVTFNKSARGIKVDEHFKSVVKRSIQITSETAGLSDITIAPLINAWGFGAKRSEKLPSDTMIASILSCTGSDKIKVKGDSVIKSQPCVQIDANGIAQGYTVDIISALFERRKIQNYLVEVGGEMRIKGQKMPAREPFKIGIEAPAENEFAINAIQKIVYLRDGAITTSGNYRRFRENNGKKFSHIINPHTGKPSDNEMISATIYAKDATTADAYDNALMLMGMKRALEFVEKRHDLAAFIIYRDQYGNIADTASSRFVKLFDQPKSVKAK